MRRLVLVGANPPPEEVDLTVADSKSESGDSSAVEAEDKSASVFGEGGSGLRDRRGEGEAPPPPGEEVRW